MGDDKMDPKREQTKGGKTGSSTDLPSGGVEQGAKTTQERVEKQERDSGGQGQGDRVDR